MNIIIFSRKKLNAFAEINRDIGQVLFGSLAIGPLISNQISWGIVFAGFMLSLLFWFISIVLVKS